MFPVTWFRKFSLIMRSRFAGNRSFSVLHVRRQSFRRTRYVGPRSGPRRIDRSVPWLGRADVHAAGGGRISRGADDVSLRADAQEADEPAARRIARRIVGQRPDE